MSIAWDEIRERVQARQPQLPPVITIEKPWGVCQRIVEDDRLIFDRLLVRQYGFSSLHYHRNMWNRFYVRSGRIAVTVAVGNGGWCIHELSAGSTLEVPSYVRHRFAVLQSGVVWETYRPAIGERTEDGSAVNAVCKINDIVRFDKNGSDFRSIQYFMDGIHRTIR